MALGPSGDFFPPGVLMFNSIRAFLRKDRQGRREGDDSLKTAWKPDSDGNDGLKTI